MNTLYLCTLVDGECNLHVLAVIGHCHSNQSFYRQIAGHQRDVGDHTCFPKFPLIWVNIVLL